MSNYFCIGGELDGKQRRVRASLMHISIPVAEVNGMFRQEIYELRRFSRGQGYPFVAFWVLAGMDEATAVRRAYELYAKAIESRPIL